MESRPCANLQRVAGAPRSGDPLSNSAAALVFALHLGVLLSCAFECSLALRYPRAQIGRALFFAPYGLIHGLVPAISLPRGWHQQDYVSAALLALLGCVSASAGWRLYERFHAAPRGQALSPDLQARLAAPSTRAALSRLVVASMVLSVLAWIGQLVSKAGSLEEALAAGRFEHRLSGNLLVAALFSHAVIKLSQLPGFLGFFLARRMKIAGVCFSLTFAAVLFVASKGARGLALGVVVSTLLGSVLATRMTRRRLWAMGLLFCLLPPLAAGLYTVRKSMSRGSLSDLAEDLVSARTYEDALHSDPLGYHQWLVAAVHFFPRYHPYLEGATYRRILLFAIPGRLVGDLKPRDTHMVFAEAIGAPGGELLTIPPSLPGDGYINFYGWPGVILVLFGTGFVYALITARFRESLAWLLTAGASFGHVAVMTMRGQPYEITAELVAGACIVLPLAGLCGVRWTRASSGTGGTAPPRDRGSDPERESPTQQGEGAAPGA